MSVLRVSEHFPRAKGCPVEAAKLFACLHEHTAQTPDEIFDGGAKGEPELSARGQTHCASLHRQYDLCMKSALDKFPQRLERVNEAYRRTYNVADPGSRDTTAQGGAEVANA